MKRIFILIVFGLSGAMVDAQTLSHRQYLYWIRYSNQMQFSPSLYWANEIDNRRFFNPDVGHQFIIHSRVHYKVKRWTFGGGITMSWIYAVLPDQHLAKQMAEIRPVAEVAYESPLGKSLLHHRLRMDNRFIQDDPTESVWQESNYLVRLRYRLQWRTPLSYSGDHAPKTILKVADEIMINSEGNTFDQHRVYVSMEFPLSEKFMLEPGYIYIYQQRMRREEFFNRHVIRVTLTHTIHRR